MTAEIGIMNKEAIAMAADSAATTMEDGQKIFTSANKLFILSKYHPVGIMVYGSAIFMGVPWESIIKIYRKKLAQRKFKELNEYGRDFVNFLDNGNPLFPDSFQKVHLRNCVYSYFTLIKKSITEQVHLKIDKTGEIPEEKIRQIVTQLIREHYETWQKERNIPSVPKTFNKNIIRKYGKLINKAIEETFEKLPLTKVLLNQLRIIASSLFSKFPEGISSGAASGVVIAGFGENNIFSLHLGHMKSKERNVSIKMRHGL